MTDLDYEHAVSSFYEGLHRFAFSLVGNENDACELTQEAYYRLLTKGTQVRDADKVKPWLFTTLYRIFLNWKNREGRLRHREISSVEHELPAVTPTKPNYVDYTAVREAMLNIQEHYRLPLVLYYMEELSYREIAKLLDVPIWTVKSRLSGAKGKLRAKLTAGVAGGRDKIIPLNKSKSVRLLRPQTL
jgi:RNA polymerase sigma-70 factor (ECF subfamily)